MEASSWDALRKQVTDPPAESCALSLSLFPVTSHRYLFPRDLALAAACSTRWLWAAILAPTILAPPSAKLMRGDSRKLEQLPVVVRRIRSLLVRGAKGVILFLVKFWRFRYNKALVSFAHPCGISFKKKIKTMPYCLDL